eukprot:scaffold8535_cov99-Amphora_coffeaeformis.AAC.2
MGGLEGCCKSGGVLEVAREMAQWGVGTKVAKAAMSTAVSMTSTGGMVEGGRGDGRVGEEVAGEVDVDIVGGASAISTTSTGQIDGGARKWAVATLRRRTNVADKRWSSGQGGKGLGGRGAWGRRLGRVSTTSTVSTVAYRKGSSAGVGWVKAMEKG